MTYVSNQKNTEPCITLHDLKKVVQPHQNRSLLSHLTKKVRSQNPVEKTLLSDLNLTIHTGEHLGIIGRNGSGKTTLLRIIAGILKPTSGEVTVRGDVLYLSGFGQGFNKKLSLVDNVLLYTALMGIDQKQIHTHIESIFSFAELSEQKNTPLGQLSDGASYRLAFATICTLISLRKPHILLLDEVFGNGGGDIFFQEKAQKRIEEIRKSGVTIVTVSHSLAYIEKNCSRVAVIEHGTIAHINEPQQAIRLYRKTK